MIARLVSMIAAVTMLALSGCAEVQDAPASNPVGTRQVVGDWSEPQDELTVRMVADRAGYHPGEQMRLWAEARNTGQNKFYVRTSGELHLVTPSGEHMVYAFSASNRANLSAGSTVMQGDWVIRLVKGSRYWRPAGEAKGKEAPLDLTRVGTYTFWHEHEAKPGWLATADPRAAEKGEAAWTGKIASPRMKIQVRELGDADKVRELTPSQRDDLRIVAEGVDKHDRRILEAANNRLAKDLLMAGNVGLADAATALVVEQVGKNPDDPPVPIASLHGALSRRAVEWRMGRYWPPVELAIRGEYIRPLAELELKSLKAWFDVLPPEPTAAATRPMRGRSRSSIDVLLALCLDSKDEPLRKPLTELAVANARLPNPLPWKDGEGALHRENIALIRYHHGRLATAWGLLRSLDVLQDKTEAEVIAILGQPTKRHQNMLEWYAASGVHVNPFIRVILDGGKVQSVSCGVK